MTGGWPLWLGRLAVALALAVVYYGLVSDRLGQALARRIAARLRGDRRLPLSQRESACKVVVAGVMQVAFLVLMVAVTGVNPLPALAPGGVSPGRLGYGLLVGFGEMGLSVSLSHAAIQLLSVVAPGGGPRSMDGWMVLLRGGWMKDFMRTTRVVSPPLAFALFMLYVSVEEVIFRGVLLTYLRPAGAGWALAGSILVFAVVQAFGMPSWRSAMFPVTGALLVGGVHGSLYLAVPTLLPLIVAHSIFVLMMYGDPLQPARFDYH